MTQVKSKAIPAGLAIDSAGNVAYDPSANVLAVVEAESRLTAAKLDHQREVSQLRAEHAKEIREIENRAAAATRQVDVLNRERAEERQQEAIRTLERITQSKQEQLERLTVSNKETLAERVDSTAKALAQKMAGDFNGIELRFGEVVSRLGEIERKISFGSAWIWGTQTPSLWNRL